MLQNDTASVGMSLLENRSVNTGGLFSGGSGGAPLRPPGAYREQGRDEERKPSPSGSCPHQWELSTRKHLVVSPRLVGRRRGFHGGFG